MNFKSSNKGFRIIQLYFAGILIYWISLAVWSITTGSKHICGIHLDIIIPRTMGVLLFIGSIILFVYKESYAEVLTSKFRKTDGHVIRWLGQNRSKSDLIAQYEQLTVIQPIALFAMAIWLLWNSF